MLDRVTHIRHVLSGTTRTFDYGYDSVGNRNWVKRDSGNGDVYDYDQADQGIVAKLDIANPNTTAPGAPTIAYDANGNRNSFAPYGSVELYATDEFNRYKKYDDLSRQVSRTKGGTTTYDVHDSARIQSATRRSTLRFCVTSSPAQSCRSPHRDKLSSRRAKS